MQRIIQINIAGRIIPIEEDAYQLLKNYVASLSKQFAKEEGKDEIIQDIESRIAELFHIRLQTGAPAIDKADVQKVMETLGAPSELNEPTGAGFTKTTYLPAVYGEQQEQQQKGNRQQYDYTQPRRLYRNTYDKILGGVCSGVANYFDIDPDSKAGDGSPVPDCWYRPCSIYIGMDDNTCCPYHGGSGIYEHRQGHGF